MVGNKYLRKQEKEAVVFSFNVTLYETQGTTVLRKLK